eukprot:Em0007g822a
MMGSTQHFALHYTTVELVASEAAALGPGALIAKVDTESVVPLHPDDRSLLGLRLGDKLYIDPMLPFGLRSAPKIFTAVADALEWCLRSCGIAHTHHYLDDFVVLGSSGYRRMREGTVSTLVSKCTELGIPLAAHKTEGPAKSIKFLGIVIDTEVGELRLPAEKLVHLRSLVADWAGRKACNRKELESLVGHLNHVCKVVRPGRSFLRRTCMIALLQQYRNKYHPIRLNHGFRSDLHWWASYAAQWNGTSYIATGVQVRFATDASGNWGCGAWHQRSWFQWKWNDVTRQLAIAVKELLPIILATLVLGEVMVPQANKDACLCATGDCQPFAGPGGGLDLSSLDAAVQHYFHHGLASSTHKSYDSALRRFYSFCTKYDVFTPFPVTEKLLCYFAAALASEGLAPQTIKCYLSGVQSMQISLGLPPPRDQSSLPILKRVLDSIRRRAFRAPSVSEWVHLIKSKCDQFGAGTDVLLGRQEKLISKARFVAGLWKALKESGYLDDQYAGHIFRMGAATAAALAGGNVTIWAGVLARSRRCLHARTPNMSCTVDPTEHAHNEEASIPQPLQAMQAYLSHCRPSKHTSATAGHASIPQPLQAMQAYLSHCRPCKHTSATAGHASIPQPLQAMQAYLIHCRPLQAYLSHCRPCKHTSATAEHASIPHPLQATASIPQPLQAMQHTSATAGHCKHTSATAGHASIPQPLQAMQAYLIHCRPLQAYLSHCRPCKHTSATAEHASIPHPLQATASIPQPLQAMQHTSATAGHCKHTSATAGHASIPQPLQAMQACCTVSLPIRTHPEPCDPSCEAWCIDKDMTLPSTIPTACGLGAATAAAQARLPPSTIQRLGRWRSSVFTTYARHPLTLPSDTARIASGP